MKELLVYAFAALGFLVWLGMRPRSKKRKPGPWLDPSPHRTLDLRRFRGNA